MVAFDSCGYRASNEAESAIDTMPFDCCDWRRDSTQPPSVVGSEGPCNKSDEFTPRTVHETWLGIRIHKIVISKLHCAENRDLSLATRNPRVTGVVGNSPTTKADCRSKGEEGIKFRAMEKKRKGVVR